MKDLHPVVQQWFDCWNEDQIDNLPISDDFSHTSPFGTITGKQRYLEIVNKNRKDFLGNKLTLERHIQQDNQVCVQFYQKNENTGLKMTVCEWHVIDGELIQEIRSFYNIGNAIIQG